VLLGRFDMELDRVRTLSSVFMLVEAHAPAPVVGV